MDFAINAKPLERYMPTNKASFKYKIWTLVVSTGFEYFILLLITVNTLILMMKVNYCHLTADRRPFTILF
jgi:voltage-dependent calcium channel N type alpha-1B